MRLKAEEVSIITSKILQELSMKNLITFHKPEALVREKMNDIFIKNLKAEDDLDRDVEKLLSQYEKQFASNQLDRRKMHQMVKAQLVKERKMVI